MTIGTINPKTAAGISFPKGALWDMDGVICDNGEIHYQSWVEAFAKYPEVPFSKELFTKTFGMNNFGVLQTILGRDPEAEELTKISDFKEELFREMIVGKVEFLPGVEEWLAGFKERGILQSIASSAPIANIDALRRELGLDDYFDAFVSASEMPSKPNPMVFETAAREIGIAPKNCVVIEDAVTGVQAGVSAGCSVIAVTTTNSVSALHKANLVVERLNRVDFNAWANSAAA